MPNSETTVMKQIMTFFNEKKVELKQKLVNNNKIAAGNKFTVTVDEWTDVNVKRYLNVTLHGKNCSYKIGLVQIEGSCDANSTQSLIKQKLDDFGLNMADDIVGSTHDGGAVMKKYGRVIPIESQLCYNHAIHLAVLDVFYKSVPEQSSINENDDEADAINNNHTENHSECDINDDADASDYENNLSSLDSNIGFIEEDNLEENLNFRPDIKKILNETRNIVNFFKRSSVRNNVLQKYVFEQEGKELKLILDCRTRWNSLIPMIERFVKLRSCILKSLEDFGMKEKLKYTEDNFYVLSSIIQMLKPIELAVKELSKDESNILTAEGVFMFLYKKTRRL